MPKGFTLIEMLVVSLVIGILAAIALPQYQYAVFKSKMKQAEVVVRALHSAERRYYLATGKVTPEKFEDLDISLPLNCVAADNPLYISCGDFAYYMNSFNTGARGGRFFTTMNPGSYNHFGIIYDTGVFTCFEKQDLENYFTKYCR